MKIKTLLIMLLMALFVPLAMNAQNEMLKKSSAHSSGPGLELKGANSAIPSMQVNAQNDMRRENGIVRSQLEPREILNITPLNEPGRLTLTVNSGTQTNAYIPIPRSYVNTGDTETQFILSASSLSGLVPDGYYANITGLSFASNNQTASLGTYYVLIQEGSFDGSGFFYGVNDMVVAYYGTLSAARGSMSFTFNQLEDGFDYFGGDLLICFYQTAAGTNSTRLNWNGVTASGMAAYWNGSNGALANFLPQTTFTYTRVEASCVKPADLDLFAIDKTAAGLYWTERGQSTQWEVSYSTTSGDPDHGTIVPVTGGEPYCVLTGLTEGTVYYAYVRSVCDSDTYSDWSDGIGFRTPATCDQPSDIAVSNVSQTSADVSWYGYDESYDVRYRKQSAGHDIANFINHQVGSNTTTTSTATDYTFSLNSYSGNGYIAIRHYNVSDMFWLDVYTVTVKDARGNVVFTGDLTNGFPDGWFAVDYDGDGYNWTAADGFVYSESYSNDANNALNPDNWLITPQVPLGGSVVINAKGQDSNYPSEVFGVFVSTTAIVEYSWTTVEDVEGESNAMAGLNPETTYEVQVRAHSCPGDWSDAVSFTTLSGCDAPAGLNTTDITGTTATLNWAGALDQYNVQYRKGFVYDFESATPWAVDNFDPCTTYDGDGSETGGIQDVTFTNQGYTGSFIAFQNGTAATNAVAHGGNAFGACFYASPAPNNDWFILPELAIENGDVLTFWAKSFSSSYLESFRVGVYSGNGNFATVLGSNSSVSNEWTEYSYSLSAYAGQTIQLAINCNSDDKFALFIDDIFVGNANADWSVPVSVTGGTYTLEGLDMNSNYIWQVQGVNCDGNGTNTGWSSASFTTLDATLVESITASDVTVLVGATATITATVLPADATNPAVTYTSANTEIATVNGNVVTGVAAGNTTITIAATDGSNVSTTINVTVTGIDVTGITADDVTVINGQTATISYTVAPANASDPSVTFTSADPAIATVDTDGVVTGVAVGTTTITIASVSNPDVTAEINVTVTSDPNAVQFTVNAPATAHLGDVITVEGVLTAPTSGNYGGFNGLVLGIDYDPEAFQFVTGSIVQGPVAQAALQLDENAMIQNYTNINATIRMAIIVPTEGVFVTTEGVVFSVQFTVLAETGEFTFTAQPNIPANFNHEADLIPYETTPSTVEITVLQTFTKHIDAYTPNTKDKYYLIASPIGEVSPEDVTNMITTDYDYDLYYFLENPAIDPETNLTLEWINYEGANGNFNLEPGKGYLYANEHDVDLTFTGTAYTGSGEVTLQKNTGAEFEGWNLVGNPFGVEAFIDRPFYRMAEGGAAIASTTYTNAINIMEGVFVEAESNDETMTFSTTNPNGKIANLALNLTQGNSFVDRAIVCFNETRQLSKFQLKKNSTKVYIPQEGKDYAVVRSEDMGVMPVNFKAENNGTYTLSFTTEEVSFAYLHLIDNMTGIDVDLLATPSYSFNAKTTDYESRFMLVFATGNSTDDTFAFFSNGSFVINNEGEATLQVIDINGRILKSESINGCANVNVNAAQGIYMLRLVNGDNVKVQKVVVK